MVYEANTYDNTPKETADYGANDCVDQFDVCTVAHCAVGVSDVGNCDVKCRACQQE